MNVGLTLFNQISLFGDFSSINTSTENTIKLIKITGDGFFPTLSNEIIIDKSPRFLSRPAFFNTEMNFHINLGMNRIDIRQEFMPERENNLEKEFMPMVLKVLDGLLGTFGLVSNRLAYNTQILLDFESIPERDNYFNLLTNDSKAFVGDIVEWNVQTVLRETSKISSNIETMNILTTFNRGLINIPTTSGIEQTDRIGYAIDINTIPQNIDNRFKDKKAYESFSTYILSKRESLISTLMGINKDA